MASAEVVGNLAATTDDCPDVSGMRCRCLRLQPAVVRRQSDRSVEMKEAQSPLE